MAVKYRAGALDVDFFGAIDTAAHTATTLNAALAWAQAHKIRKVRFRAHSYDLSAAHILVPAGVELTGHGGATVLNGGAFAIISDGVVSHVKFGTGWSLFTPFTGVPSAAGGVALIGGRLGEGVTLADPTVELWPTRRPHNSLARIVAGMRTTLSFKKLKITVLSDSLSFTGSGSGVTWPDLVFNSAYATAEGAGYYLPTLMGGTNNITLNNLAIPGSVIGVDTPFVAYEQLAISAGDGLDNQVLPAESYATHPTILDSDLVIINQGHNGWSSGGLEDLVMHLRRAGIEVILSTESPNGTNAAAYAQNLWALHRIADAYGCAVADVYAGFLREIYTGRATSAGLVADGTHPNQAGWNIYATVIRDTFLDQMATAAPVAGPLPAKRVVNPNNPTGAIDTNTYGFTATSSAKSAGVTMVTPSDTARSPLAGRRSSLANTAYSIPAGEYVEFPVCDGFSVAVQAEATATAARMNVSTTSVAGVTTSVATNTSGTSAGTPYSVTVTAGNWSGSTTLKSGTIRITCTSDATGPTSGSLVIYGVSWPTKARRYQPRNDDGSFRGVVQTGTWGVAAGPWFGQSNIPYTDTLNDTFTFPFVGDGVMVKTNRSAYGGVAAVTIDGISKGNIDNYTGAAADYIQTSVFDGLAPGAHVLTLKYVSNNPSAAGAISTTARGGHRISIMQIAALDSRMNIPVADITRPASEFAVGQKGVPGAQGTPGAGTPNVQSGTASGVWTNPGAPFTTVRFWLFPPGGPGGSGACASAGAARSGGSAGGGAGLSYLEVPLASLPATLPVTMPAAGTGGAGVSGTNSNGNPGTTSGITASIGSILRATGGQAGNGGTSSAPSGGLGGAGNQGSGAAGAVAAVGAAGVQGGTTPTNSRGSSGGGSGGGIDAAGVAYKGGAGGPNPYTDNVNAAGGNVGGSAPVVGSSPGAPVAGSGSAGGAASATGNGQDGAKGGFPGGGGGGGGDALNPFTSGKGGDGGDGYWLGICT